MKLVKFLFSISFIALLAFQAQSAVPASGFAIVPSVPTELSPTALKKQQQLQFMKWFVTLSPKEYGIMRGKKLNVFEKLSFKITQLRMKQQLRAGKSNDGEGTNWGGLLLGVLLGPIGIVGAYIFSSDKNFIKWTWIGGGIWLALCVLFARVLF
jgi:hypothetical protein